MTPRRLEDHLGYWLRCLSNAVHGAFAARLERHGVSVAQWVVMRTLYGRERVSLRELADETGVDAGALSRMIQRLVRKGLVSRTASDGDRRALHLKLTASGQTLVPALAAEADHNDAEFFGAITPRRRAELFRIVRALLKKNGWDERRKPTD